MSLFNLMSCFGKQIVTRKAMKNFFNLIEDSSANDLVLDFAQVDFISRSCADEYIKCRESSRKNIKEINVSDNVREMIYLTILQHKKSMGLVN